MIDELISITKDYSGNIITVGFGDESKLIKTLKKNKNVSQVFSLVRRERISKTKQKKKFKLFKNKFNVKKIRKAFKKVDIDYEVCNYEDTKYILNHFIKNSILLINKEILYYVKDNDFDHEELMYRFQRYGCDVSAKGYKGFHIVRIDPSKINKINPFYHIYYIMRDISYNIIEIIASILMS